jgi:hypothetical protein
MDVSHGRCVILGVDYNLVCAYIYIYIYIYDRNNEF